MFGFDGDRAVPVTYLIKFDVHPEQRGRFLSLLNEVLDAMRSEPTFHEAVLHRDPASENRFMLYETWESHDDVMDAQIKRPYRERWHSALPELLVAPRDISMWEPIRADRSTA
jgi:quinol monooxygenase YgiN